MKRVDSRTTLDVLSDHLADASIQRPERQARVGQTVDRFIGSAADEGEILAKTRRLLERTWDLPPASDRMRIALARTIVAEAAKRSPKLAQTQAYVTGLTNLEEDMQILCRKGLEPLRAELPETAYRRRVRATQAAVAALCPTERTIVDVATLLSPEALHVLSKGDEAFLAISRKVGARMDEVVEAIRGTRTVPGFTVDEALQVPRVEAFMVATGFGSARPIVEEGGRRAFLRAIMASSTPEQLDQLIGLYSGSAGAEVRKFKETATPAMRQTFDALVRERVGLY